MTTSVDRDALLDVVRCARRYLEAQDQHVWVAILAESDYEGFEDWSAHEERAHEIASTARQELVEALDRLPADTAEEVRSG